MRLPSSGVRWAWAATWRWAASKSASGMACIPPLYLARRGGPRQSTSPPPNCATFLPMLSLRSLFLAAAVVTCSAALSFSQQRPLTIPDVMAWKGVAGTALSNDGSWFAARETALEGDGEVVFRQTHGDKHYTFPLGEAPQPAAGAPGGGGRGGRGGGSNLAFSSDARFGAF